MHPSVTIRATSFWATLSIFFGSWEIAPKKTLFFNFKFFKVVSSKTVLLFFELLKIKKKHIPIKRRIPRITARYLKVFGDFLSSLSSLSSFISIGFPFSSTSNNSSPSCFFLLPFLYEIIYKKNLYNFFINLFLELAN